MPVNTLLQMRRGSAATWTSTNPTLSAGEWGYETDTGRAKVGDGSTVWTSLKYTKLRYDDLITGSGVSITTLTDGNSQVTGLSFSSDLAAGDNITLTESNGTITINGQAGITLSEGTGIHIVVDGADHEINISGLTSSNIGDFNDAVDARVTAASISADEVMDIVGHPSSGIQGVSGVSVFYLDNGNGLNIGLTNNSITLGSDSLALGSTTTSISGLTSVSSTSFIGDLTGNADTSDQVKTQQGSADANHYITFVDTDNGSATAETVYTDAGLYYNPSSNKLSVGVLSTTGNITIGGDLTVAGTTTTVNSTVVEIGDAVVRVNTSGLAEGGIEIQDGSTGNYKQFVWSNNNSRFEAEGSIQASGFIGDLTGNADTVTNGVYTTDTGTVTSTMILDGTIVNADISASAGIDISKLSASGLTIGDSTYVLGDTTTALSGMTSFAGTSAANPVYLYYAVIDGGSP